MRKIKLFIATSLDGYIARKDDSLDWLDAFEGSEGAQEDYGYLDFIKDIDTLIMGSATYQVVIGMGVEWPYKERAYILSHNQIEISSPNTFHLDANQLDEKLSEIIQSEGKDIWVVGGGKLIGSFLRKGIVDEMILSIIPVLLGEGIRLFPNQEMQDVKFKLTDSKPFNSGIVNLHYKKLEH